MSGRLIASLWFPVLALQLVACSSRDDLPPGAYKNDEFHFAVVAPRGWVMVTPKTAEEFLQVYGDRLQHTFRDRLKHPATGRTRFVLSYVKADAMEEYLPNISVVHNSVGLQQVTDTEKEKSRRALRANIGASGWPDFREESAEIVEVNRRKAIRVVYSGTVTSRLYSDPNSSKTHQVKFVELMIPSKNMTHFLSLTADQRQFDGYLSTFNDVLNSFRSFGTR